jgi:putative membrane protein
MGMILVKWALYAIALLGVANIVPGISITNFGSALLVSFVIGLLNFLVKPIMVLLAIPLLVVTLGLFYFVLNALLFWLASLIVPGFVVNGFIAAFLGALLFSVLAAIIEKATE